MLRPFLLVVALASTAALLADPMVVPDRPTGPTSAAKTKYFVSKGALVLLKKGTPSAKFGITLEIRKNLPKGATVVAEFENPPNPNEHFVVPVTLDDSEHLVIQSPDFEGIYNNRGYLSRVNVVDKDGKTISSHEQWIWFGVPDQVITAFGTKILP